MNRSRTCRLLFIATLGLLPACASRPSSDQGAAVPSGATAQTPEGMRAGGRVRVLVYNIHAGKDAAGVDNLERVAALVRDADVDVALLQEVDQFTRRSGKVDQPAVLAASTGLHVAFGSALDYDGGEYGVAILSRWPITRDTLVHLPVEPPQARAGGSREPRGALRAEVATPWGNLVVINTHLDASGTDTWRRQEVRTLLALATAARAQHRNVIVGGDMNSTPESAVQQDVRATRFRDAFAECGRGDGMTFPADSSVKRIDYLYIPEGVQCVKAEVGKSDISDHRPLFVEIIVP